MQYTFDKVKENYPKRAYRSKRTLKKLHLQEFGVVLASIVINASVFDSQYCDTLLDAMYEHDDGIFVCGGKDTTTVLVEIPVGDFSIDYVKNYCHKLLLDLSEIDLSFAEIENITVQYGDAYYGEW
ncbi:putative structural protein [Erwinia phage pEa_SNUABM_50]|uniref:Uncharacterized protein n=4 Tax=Eneladusvirus BF TaxID=2560751 RepID=A0A1S6UAS0_9CAUD|nr:virion structural protein [Serratia phage BF]QOI71242.1 putative structural protein [Erwinia phage pEa_SNUABM_12]QOI71786.1 putative structural protein [Erwinia phage pEa_SNUABM_47]QOI72325.1 putative structural protein [Erwinia phage pEa_SNUABM_50]QXO11451.1 hypothetical protein pEaSNUABM19_00305 [Erwinia phage pEa_SNUABM_19]QXO11999.1 hypothetical protein pEaSNUABM44_00303 [Erwinia phage pEa_SNUABM_44]QXO12552.1 hypothetical protein pEaSNUABM49_00306 [Erwinia phage pEa_SNUABM_49]